MTIQEARLKKLMVGVLLACLVSASPAGARRKHKPQAPPFTYAGGTEIVPYSCGGNLEVSTEALVFKCPRATLNIPFGEISLMQYRSDVSHHVSKLNVKWNSFPRRQGGSKNRYFTIVYGLPTGAHVVILEVTPQSMRPYLAEIELKSGKRVEVEGYEDYGQ